MDLGQILPILLGAAWLAPLASFAAIVAVGCLVRRPWKGGGYLATAAILTSFVLSISAFALWLTQHPVRAVEHHAAHDAGHAEDDVERAADEHAGHEPNAPAEGAERAAVEPSSYYGDWYALGEFGSLRITIGYYIDALTVAMFAMVTLIATLIHFYAIGYMHDELHDVTDHEVATSDGHHLHRPGRFHRFFQYLSLFCFSMLGLVIAGNIAMVFVFWELVGICSYFLIGFYIERKSASNAANKAFIVNRIGDFGMIVGLMALWGGLGTFAFGGDDGIFAQVRPGPEHRLTVPDGMVTSAAFDEIEAGAQPTAEQVGIWRSQGYGYWLLVIAGLGIFCGCVGKSAQFPLHVWLPDAMEGPTPVSALVHSATMVAAGVYLAGRFFPVFAPEVLLTIAYIGGITLFIAATIAITATDIKRVLAYSTVSQLGYMMLAIGVGGWLAGLFHLITHAFFKSLLFMCSGSVIHACHTNEMTKMGGLRKKMPWTAYTMLAGCLAITGAPFFSGFYSKDSILAQALNFTTTNPAHSVLFYLVAVGAAMTAFYMFRLWYVTFAGKPRDHRVHDHAHESPKIMYVPLVILAAFAVGVGWRVPFTDLSVANLLEQARPAGSDSSPPGYLLPTVSYPSEHASHEPQFHNTATLVASGTALAGFLLATAIYGLGLINPDDVRQGFGGVYRFLRNKWYFDEVYQVLFVRPTLFLSQRIAELDRKVIDGAIDGSARWVRRLSLADDWFDRLFVDGLVNLTARWTYSLANGLRGVQTGKVRQYVLLIVVGLVALLFLVRWSMALAG